MLGINTPNDYGKKSIKIRNNKRVLNENNNSGQNVINLTAPIQKSTARNNQKIKDSKRGSLIDNKRITGNYGGSKKSIVYDPSDVTRPTIKQTSIHNKHSGNMGPSMYKGVAYDPNDITRTTIKETNIHNNHAGILSSGAPSRGVVYDPNSKAKTTMKQTTIDNKRKGNINSMTKSGTYLKNKDSAKITTKQTILEST
jgi:hypothetical protein